MLVEDIRQINNINDLSKVLKRVLNIDIISDDAYYLLNDKIMLKNFLFNLLSEQKKNILKNNNDKINIKTLFKNQIIKKEKLYRIYKSYPNINRNLGTFPSIFLEKTENKGACAKKIFDIMSKYSMRLNYEIPGRFVTEEILLSAISNFERELSDVTNQKIQILFVGNGCNGNAFKISVITDKEQEDFLYKIFYPRRQDKNMAMEFRHGSDLEVIYSYFGNKNERKNKFAKFYAGRFSTQYDKDAFLLTEFVKMREDYSEPNNLYLDYIISSDTKVANKINGKIVDFGALKIIAPELVDKNLRKLVRIVLMRINKSFDKDIIKYNWKMSLPNCNSLKKYVNNSDFDEYLKALKIIKKYIPQMPEEFLKKLKDIKKWDNDYCINIAQCINDDIITADINKLKKNIQKLCLKIKSSMDGDEFMFGYIILDLYNNRNAVYRLDKDNNIINIRLEKLSDGKYITLLELDKEQIALYKNPDMASVLCS